MAGVGESRALGTSVEILFGSGTTVFTLVLEAALATVLAGFFVALAGAVRLVLVGVEVVFRRFTVGLGFALFAPACSAFRSLQRFRCARAILFRAAALKWRLRGVADWDVVAGDVMRPGRTLPSSFWISATAASIRFRSA